MSVGEALASVRARLDAAARAAGRDPQSVRLVAVSKKQPLEKLRAAYAAGQRDFGESYAQELAEKAAALADLAGLRWHFIGHLQRNKAKLVAPTAALIHALDTGELGRELVKRSAGRTIACLIEVNVGREAQKHGCMPEAVSALATELGAVAGLSFEGLMCIPPAGLAPRPFFAALRALRDQLAPLAKTPLELSMGMSEDFEAAIAEGSTLVRVGTAIFGPRTS